MIKLLDILIESISRAELQSLEQYVDRIFSAVGIDVEFTKHFFDRVNDPRNTKPISHTDLSNLFRKTYEKYGEKISLFNPEAEAVIVDMQKDINIPFILKYDPRSQELDLVTKTVMRKKNFQTPNQKLPV